MSIKVFHTQVNNVMVYCVVRLSLMTCDWFWRLCWRIKIIDWMARLWSCHSNTARAEGHGWRGFTSVSWVVLYVHQVLNSACLQFKFKRMDVIQTNETENENRSKQMFPILFAMTGWGCGVFCQDLKGVVKGFIFWVSARERVLMDPRVNTFSAQCHSEGLQSSSMCFPNH